MTVQFTTANTATTQASSGPRISAAATDWLLARGLSRETLEQLPVASGITFFPGLKRKAEGIFFKFSYGWKARALEEKDHVAAKGWKPTFWNLEAVLGYLATIPNGTVFITEGEFDTCALVEAGVPAHQVLSVPNGAQKAEGDEYMEMPWLLDALKAGLNKAKRVIWCGDADQAGLWLRAQMAHQFGAAKFFYVDWPEGCKDANDVLLKHDPLYLRTLVFDQTKPWPTEGLYRISEMPEPPKLTLWEPEIDCLKGRVFLAPQTLSVVTGQPGHGKSTFFGQVWFEIIRKYGLAACFASFETRPKPYMRRQIRTLFNGGVPEFKLTESEIRKADEWMEDRYFFIHHPEQRPTLEWLLDQAEVAVVRYGARLLQIDPWNRLEATRGRDETETEYIARCLRALTVFGVDMGCHVQVVAHPAKMDRNRKGQPPELEDISGSKNWDNMPDQGFVIHRPLLYDEEAGKRNTEAKFIVRKTRFEELGYPLTVWVNYDLDTRTYVGMSLPAGED